MNCEQLELGCQSWYLLDPMDSIYVVRMRTYYYYIYTYIYILHHVMMSYRKSME